MNELGRASLSVRAGVPVFPCEPACCSMSWQYVCEEVPFPTALFPTAGAAWPGAGNPGKESSETAQTIARYFQHGGHLAVRGAASEEIFHSWPQSGQATSRCDIKVAESGSMQGRAEPGRTRQLSAVSSAAELPAVLYLYARKAAKKAFTALGSDAAALLWRCKRC